MDSIREEKIWTIKNDGTDGIKEIQNQCLIISILDYLRYIHPDFKNNPEREFSNIETFITKLKQEEIIDRTWDVKKPYEDTQSNELIINNIARKYNLNIHIYQLQYGVIRDIDRIFNNNGKYTVYILNYVQTHFDLMVLDPNTIHKYMGKYPVLNEKVYTRYYFTNPLTGQEISLDDNPDSIKTIDEDLSLLESLYNEEISKESIKKPEHVVELQEQISEFKKAQELYNQIYRDERAKSEKLAKLNSELDEYINKIGKRTPTKDEQNEIDLKKATINSIAEDPNYIPDTIGTSYKPDGYAIASASSAGSTRSTTSTTFGQKSSASSSSSPSSSPSLSAMSLSKSTKSEIEQMIGDITKLEKQINNLKQNIKIIAKTNMDINKNFNKDFNKIIANASVEKLLELQDKYTELNHQMEMMFKKNI